MVGKWEDFCNAENRKQNSWSAEEKNISCSDPTRPRISGGASAEIRKEDKSLRNFRANSEGTNTPVSVGGRLDKGKVFEFLKKLARRLELLEQKYKKYVGDHRSRLIARLNENEEFALDTDSEAQQLKFDIEEVARVLGASETIE